MKLLMSSISTLLLVAVSGCGRGAGPEPAMQPASGIDRGERGRASMTALESPAAPRPNVASASPEWAQTPAAASPRSEPSRAPPTARTFRQDSSSTGVTLVPLIPMLHIASGTVEDGVATVTSARCQREARCGKVGAGRAYADVATCERDLAGDTREVLDPACHAGVDDLAIDRCADTLHRLECERTVDTLGRINQCRSSSLCVAW